MPNPTYSIPVSEIDEGMELASKMFQSLEESEVNEFTLFVAGCTLIAFSLENNKKKYDDPGAHELLNTIVKHIMERKKGGMN